jgi:hypothetical protein
MVINHSYPPDLLVLNPEKDRANTGKSITY